MNDEASSDTARDVAAGPAPPGRAADPAVLAARVAALCERIAARTAESAGAGAGGHDGQARRARLTRHHDDVGTLGDAAGAHHGDDQDIDRGEDGSGWSR